jgi:hypothetical protein
MYPTKLNAKIPNLLITATTLPVLLLGGSSIFVKHNGFQVFENSQRSGKEWAIMNQHPPAHHEGWMISDQETVFCWVSVP